MDRYDGVVWNVAGDGSAQASGEFRRVGSRSTRPCGARRHVDFTVDQLAGICSRRWVRPRPSTSRTRMRRAPCATTTRRVRRCSPQGCTEGWSTASTSSCRPSPTRPRWAARRRPTWSSRRSSARPTRPRRPQQRWRVHRRAARGTSAPPLRTISPRKASSADGGDLGLALAVRARGSRITALLGGDLMVGDGEQYAAAMALMAREMDLPARVVLGFVPTPEVDGGPQDGPVQVTGKDVQAWVEVAFRGYGWVPFDPTPPPEQTPQQQDQEKPSEPNPQVVQPPPPPPAAVTPPDEEHGAAPDRRPGRAGRRERPVLADRTRGGGRLGTPAGARFTPARHRRAQGPAEASPAPHP